MFQPSRWVTAQTTFWCVTMVEGGNKVTARQHTDQGEPVAPLVALEGIIQGPEQLCRRPTAQHQPKQPLRLTGGPLYAQVRFAPQNSIIDLFETVS